MKILSMKSYTSSQKCSEKKRKNGQVKVLHKKTNTFTVIESKIVQEQ